MRRLTGQQLTESARQMAIALIEACRLKEINPVDASLIIGAACAEAMAYIEGRTGAVESLRLIADVAERETLRPN